MVRNRPPCINVVARDKKTGINSYTWKLWWHRVSFYAVPTFKPLSGFKVSLHGADEFHPKPGYKLALDRGAASGAADAGGVATGAEDGLWFSGRPMAPGVTHVMTLRWTSGLFRKGLPSGPWPGNPPDKDLSCVLSAPTETWSTDLDVYVCEDEPWWREEQQARRDNACIGPISNESGTSLTGVSVRRRNRLLPTPEHARMPSPQSKLDKTRGIGYAVHDDVLFVVEQWTSLKLINALSESNRNILRAGH